MAKEYRFISRFESYAKVITPTETDRFLAKASLQPLKALLPAGTDVENSDDVLYFAADGALGGAVNRNDDSISAETAIAIHRSAINKFISTDHDRDKIVGAVINAGLSRYGTNDLLTSDEAAKLTEPFNMPVAGVIWKVIANQLAKYLVRVGDSLDKDALSLSWEIAFDQYDIAVGSKNLFEARIVKEGTDEWAELDRRLRCNGGTGLSVDGKGVYRVIAGEPILLGYSVVERPAAGVKGILPITAPTISEQPESAPTDASTQSDAASVTPTLPATAAAAVEEKIITPTESRVTPANVPMKIESLAQLSANWSDIRKLESAAAVEDFVKALQKGEEAYVAQLAAEKNLVQTLQSSKAELEQAKADAEKRAGDLQSQIDLLKQSAAQAEANQKFKERMANLDESFELDDQDRELLAPEIRSLADDTAFAAFKKKQEKLMCGKKKGAKASDLPATTPAVVPAVVPAVTAAPVVAVTEAIASITPVGAQVVPGGNTLTVDVSLASDMDQAFAETVTVRGKTIKQIRAEKAAADKQ